jgi:hypothetical protein
MVVGPRGRRPLTRPAALLGQSADTPFPLQRERIRHDEILVVMGGDVLRLRDPDGNLVREETLAAASQGLTSASASEIIDCLSAAVLNQTIDKQHVQCTLLVARKK